MQNDTFNFIMMDISAGNKINNGKFIQMLITHNIMAISWLSSYFSDLIPLKL